MPRGFRIGFGLNQLTASQGGFTVNGSAAGLTVGPRTVTAAQGALTITGQAAALTYTAGADPVLVASQGSRLLTGQAATLTYTAAGTFKYVRQGATGAGTGNNWTDAYTALPTTLTRGTTYYVAGGSYAGRTFSTANSGTTLITIKKATVADHGTASGWNDTYGTTQASFTSSISISTSYWVIDGSTRNENDWFAGTSYGFAIGSASSHQQIFIQNTIANPPTNIQIRNAWVRGFSGALPDTTQRIYAIDTDHFDTQERGLVTGLVLHRVYVSDSNNCFFLRTTGGAIVEYCASSGVKGNGANHGEIVNLYYSGLNCTVRWCHFKDAYLSFGGTALIAIQHADGLLCYGNVFENFTCGDGAVGFIGGNASNCTFDNNTIVKGNAASGFQSNGSNNLVRNNLWINCVSIGSSGTASYNAFSGTGYGTNAQNNVPTSIFVNYAGGDYRLAVATQPGTSLAAPRHVDLLGNPRGADGVWDRGAFEKV